MTSKILSFPNKSYTDSLFFFFVLLLPLIRYLFSCLKRILIIPFYSFQSGDFFTLESANKIYIGGKCKIEPDFSNTAQKYFNSEVETINFSKQTEAVNKINSWVESKTKNKIKELIQQGWLSKQEGGKRNVDIENSIYVIYKSKLRQSQFIFGNVNDCM